jgi:hypothetical protein
MFVVGYGEIYLVSDTDEMLLRQGDTALVKGVNHAWSNRSAKPCMLIAPTISDQATVMGLNLSSRCCGAKRRQAGVRNGVRCVERR